MYQVSMSSIGKLALVASWFYLTKMLLLLLALPFLQGSPLVRQNPRRGKSWLKINYSRRLVSVHIFPEPIQEQSPSLSVKFSGPWGPIKLWMLGPWRSFLDNLFSQVWEKREGTCVGTGFCDAELLLGLLGVLVSFMFPYTLPLYNFLGSILVTNLSFQNRPDVGEAALATELCGLDRAGRQNQHTKCSGPFKMSRQEARLGEKQRHSPHTRA